MFIMQLVMDKNRLQAKVKKFDARGRKVEKRNNSPIRPITHMEHVSEITLTKEGNDKHSLRIKSSHLGGKSFVAQLSKKQLHNLKWQILQSTPKSNLAASPGKPGIVAVEEVVEDSNEDDPHSDRSSCLFPP